MSSLFLRKKLSILYQTPFPCSILIISTYSSESAQDIFIEQNQINFKTFFSFQYGDRIEQGRINMWNFVHDYINLCYSTKLLLMQLTRSIQRLCGSSKYFLDDKFKNATAIAYDTPGALSRLCEVFARNNVSLSYLRTHCLCHKKGEQRKYRLEISYLKDHHFNFQNAKTDLEKKGILINESNPIRVPWFPQNMQDVDKIGRVLLEVNESKEHSQFQDPQYRGRRDQIAKVAKEYRLGQIIPDIQYTQQETDLWCQIYKRLTTLHQKAMSQRFLKQAEQLNRELGIDRRIPQLRELSGYLHSRTGWRIKPTHGILSQREFLNALAFKLFCSTQYLRNVKNPDYTPEPDIVHEFVGHVPMFADPDVAEISHQIGLLSLGASDEEVAKLGSLYWYTLEFGVCKEGDKRLGYGAGVASSIAEIENMLSGKPKFEKLDIFRDCTSPYPIQTVQPIYRVTESFSQSIKELENYGRSIMKPITTVYNEQTEEIEYDRSIQGVYTEQVGPQF